LIASAPRQETGRGRLSGRALIILLGCLSILGPFSNDTLLPNFPYIDAHLGVGEVRMQQVLTVYFVPFAVMMLFHGSLSDSFGRRRVIMVGMAAYAIAALVGAYAHDFQTLLAARFLQGLSAGAEVIVGRAIVRDLHAGEHAQRALALVTIIFGIAPGIAPIIGGWIGHLWGWRSVFGFLFLLATLLFVLTWRWLPETLPAARRVPLSPGSVLRGFAAGAGDRRFMLLVLAYGFNFAGFFIYIVSAPAFGYRILGLERTEFVWIFGPAILGMIVGSFIAGGLAGRLRPLATVALAYVLMGGFAAFNVLYHLHHPATLPVSILPVFGYTLGLGIAMPTITLQVLDLMPTRRGLASSMLGFSQSAFSALLAGVVSHRVYGSASGLAACSLAMACLGMACWIACNACLAGRAPRESAR
jgi:DHA1 family bicyclomycin/chloramphenicol resistance-like MFS transporter